MKFRKIKISFYIVSAFFITALIFTGCKDTISGNELDKVIIPSSNVSFSKYIFPIFNVKCSTAGCHDDATRAGDLALTNWGNATVDPNIVFPFNPDNSLLIQSIEGVSGVRPMPPIGFVSPLTPNQIKGIRTWVAEGAKNN